MPTISECLRRTYEIIQASEAVVLATNRHKTELHAQIEATRKLIAEAGLTVRRSSLTTRGILHSSSLPVHREPS